ncbi:MAG: hypothetical protein QOJ07_3707, partial [Thermoleophilaceae bacterium]|nr:hypothetical protein [Thermoleophilaceae bacterium]
LDSAAGIISSNGFAVCGKLPVISIFGTVTVGHHWNHDYTDLFPAWGFGGCDLSGYRVTANPARATAAAAGLPVTLPHSQAATLAVRGSGGAPSVTLTAPDGREIVPTTGSLQDAVAAVTTDGGPEAAAFSVPSSSTTGVLLKNPAAGTWRVAAQPDSAPLAEVSETHTLAAPAVKGRVLGSGRKLRLRYSLHPRPGMTVTFAELGQNQLHEIGKARGAAGTIAFSPADGPAGTRQIVALIDQGGLPRPRVALARFRAPGPLRPGRVPGLKLAFRGHALTIGFGAASNAKGYRIRVSSTDGKNRLLLATAKRRSARLAGFGPGASATVTVTAYAANGHSGPKTVRRVRSGR